jgi:hypothetical protein
MKVVKHPPLPVKKNAMLRSVQRSHAHSGRACFAKQTAPANQPPERQETQGKDPGPARRMQQHGKGPCLVLGSGLASEYYVTG